MGKAVPEQHPAVVLRSHYVHLRALLVAALIAVLGLTAAVVIVANDSDELVKGTPAPAIESGGPNERSADLVPGVNLPARPTQAQAFPGQAQQVDQIGIQPGATRYDGGPNEGSADVSTAKPGAVPQTGSPRYDGGPNEGSADVTTDSGGKASVMPQTGTRYDGGPNEGSADVTASPFPCSALALQTDPSPCGGN
jgi:hypothetical protein